MEHLTRRLKEFISDVESGVVSQPAQKQRKARAPSEYNQLQRTAVKRLREGNPEAKLSLTEIQKEIEKIKVETGYVPKTKKRVHKPLPLEVPAEEQGSEVSA
jgi:hypothetical protein